MWPEAVPSPGTCLDESYRLVDVYPHENAHAVVPHGQHRKHELPEANFLETAIELGVELIPIKRDAVFRRDLIIAGGAKSSVSVSHRLPPEAMQYA
jgi:hypothetical protein